MLLALHLLWGLLLWAAGLRADLDRFRLHVVAEDADNPLLAVNLGDQVYQDAPRVADGAGKVINKVERRNVAFTLPCADRDTAGFVRAVAERGVVNAQNRLHAVRRLKHGLDHPGGHRVERLALRHIRPVELKESVR